jgi:hypothetical protein
VETGYININNSESESDDGVSLEESGKRALPDSPLPGLARLTTHRVRFM